MKTINKYILMLLCLFMTAACTEDFEEINRSPTSATTIDPSLLFTRSLVTGAGISYRVYQLVHQTSTGYWSQHWANIQPAFSGDIYEPSPGNGIWSYYYSRTYFAPLNLNYETLKLLNEIDPNPMKLACAKIWNVYMFSLMTDMYGDIPYTEAFINNEPKFDKQSEIYAAFFTTLDEAIKMIKDNQGLGYPSFGTADVLFNGDLEKWIRFANAQKLRLGMRISNVDAAKAQEVVSSIPLDELILDNSQNAKMWCETATNAVTHDVKNALGFVYNWHEIRVSKTMMDKLKPASGAIDPRLYRFAEPNDDGEYVGLPNGQSRTDLAAEKDYFKEKFNNVGPAYNSQEVEVAYHLLTSAEVNFLLAEAALKGWVSGSAQDYYESGIMKSMEQFEVTDATAISDFMAAPEVSYNAASAMEQIMTQKWVAFFTNPMQAWCEMRRTGIPAPMPLVDAFPGNEDMPRRIPYSTDEANYNSDQYNVAVTQMGGDTQYTRMWWDTQN
ncbi:SusD/RagB family nutrient-binding outer membrane lipoprotein [Limibacter armeniacum]|uniref:SusD/RagB family nutrient-binding outer membrane lipoprotein n=1 Tax=Limibacter armeniacum TaxID=466084 RepID=UPI002FE5C692